MLLQLWPVASLPQCQRLQLLFQAIVRLVLLWAMTQGELHLVLSQRRALLQCHGYLPAVPSTHRAEGRPRVTMH